MDFDRNKSWERWAMRVFGTDNRQAGEPSVAAKAEARRKREQAEVAGFLRQFTLVSPLHAAELEAWPVMDGSTLGDL